MFSSIATLLLRQRVPIVYPYVGGVGGSTRQIGNQDADGASRAKPQVTELRPEASPRLTARLAGLFSVLVPAAVAVQVNVLGMFFVAGDPAATATNILANASLFQVGFACSLLAVGFNLARAFFFHELFRPVSTRVASFAVLVILVGCAVQALASTFYLAPVMVLNGATSASTTGQLQELAYLFIRLNKQTSSIYVVFLGLWFFLTGWLIYRSRFMPRVLGILNMITGAGWMMSLYPPLARQISPFMLGASLLGEVPLALWLLAKGVDVQRWQAQAADGRD